MVDMEVVGAVMEAVVEGVLDTEAAGEAVAVVDQEGVEAVVVVAKQVVEAVAVAAKQAVEAVAAVEKVGVEAVAVVVATGDAVVIIPGQGVPAATVLKKQWPTGRIKVPSLSSLKLQHIMYVNNVEY